MRSEFFTLLWMLALVLANGVFAAAEIAVVSVRRSRIKQLAEDGDGRARAVERLHEGAEQFLATVQIGITVVSALAAALGGASVARPIAEALRQLPVHFLQDAAGEIALALVVAGYSFFSLLLGELIPKSLALRYAEPIALRMARLMSALGSLVRPLVWLLTGAANLVLKPFHDRTRFGEARMTAEEIKLLIDEAAESGSIEKRRAEIIERAVDFGDLTAGDVLVPRSDMIAIDLKDPPEEIRKVVLEKGHTRMPVVDGSLDKVVGFVTSKDILSLSLEKELLVLQDVIRPAFFVPQSMRAVDLLRAMQKRREHLAIVVDEYGGTAGLCTTEDLVEEIVGEIFSEDSTVPELIKREPQGTALVSALLPVREFNREFDADLPESPDYETLGGLLTHLAGAIPTLNQVFQTHGFEITVIARSERRVEQVRVRRLEPTAPPGP